MEIIKTPIQDLLIIKPRVFEDKRGYFLESYKENLFKEQGISAKFVQDNESKSNYGVVRGLHYQLEPYAQAKLVRVIYGKVFDVAVDLRKNSPTYGKWHGIKLSADNKIQFFIPRGFAHGFSVMSHEAIFCYKCDNYYNIEKEKSINPMDDTLGIDWKLKKEDIILSAKDMNSPKFLEAETNFMI